MNLVSGNGFVAVATPEKFLFVHHLGGSNFVLCLLTIFLQRNEIEEAGTKNNFYSFPKSHIWSVMRNLKTFESDKTFSWLWYAKNDISLKARLSFLSFHFAKKWISEIEHTHNKRRRLKKLHQTINKCARINNEHELRVIIFIQELKLILKNSFVYLLPSTDSEALIPQKNQMKNFLLNSFFSFIFQSRVENFPLSLFSVLCDW